jgi:hypothetical protein
MFSRRVVTTAVALFNRLPMRSLPSRSFAHLTDQRVVWQHPRGFVPFPRLGKDEADLGHVTADEDLDADDHEHLVQAGEGDDAVAASDEELLVDEFGMPYEVAAADSDGSSGGDEGYDVGLKRAPAPLVARRPKLQQEQWTTDDDDEQHTARPSFDSNSRAADRGGQPGGKPRTNPRDSASPREQHRHQRDGPSAASGARNRGRSRGSDKTASPGAKSRARAASADRDGERARKPRVDPREQQRHQRGGDGPSAAEKRGRPRGSDKAYAAAPSREAVSSGAKSRAHAAPADRDGERARKSRVDPREQQRHQRGDDDGPSAAGKRGRPRGSTKRHAAAPSGVSKSKPQAAVTAEASQFARPRPSSRERRVSVEDARTALGLDDGVKQQRGDRGARRPRPRG